jgi:hypothetical protein
MIEQLRAANTTLTGVAIPPLDTLDERDENPLI